MELTEGTLLGGRVVYRQPRQGYRTGIEPVLMAASIAAAPGMRVLEAGTGAGAALLCLLAREPGAVVTGVERDAALAALARLNLASNAMHHATVHLGDLLSLPARLPFDHVMANPPWHDADATASPDLQRDAAKRARPGLLARWAASLAGQLRPGGSLTFVLRAASMSEGLAAMGTAGFGSHALMPLWPRAGQEARLILMRSIKSGRGPCRMLPGLVLHEGDAFTPEARAILWDGRRLAGGDVVG